MISTRSQMCNRIQRLSTGGQVLSNNVLSHSGTMAVSVALFSADSGTPHSLTNVDHWGSCVPALRTCQRPRTLKESSEDAADLNRSAAIDTSLG